VERAQKEQKASARPKLKVKLENAKSYDIVFIGYPNWWGSFPMPVATFLEENDFSGKTLIPFCTHEGSRLGRSVEDLTKMCPKSKILEGLAIRGRSVKTAHEDVAQWVKKIGL
jgi:flavodoxin